MSYFYLIPRYVKFEIFKDNAISIQICTKYDHFYKKCQINQISTYYYL